MLSKNLGVEYVLWDICIYIYNRHIYIIYIYIYNIYPKKLQFAAYGQFVLNNWILDGIFLIISLYIEIHTNQTWQILGESELSFSYCPIQFSSVQQLYIYEPKHTTYKINNTYISQAIITYGSHKHIILHSHILHSRTAPGTVVPYHWTSAGKRSNKYIQKN